MKGIITKIWEWFKASDSSTTKLDGGSKANHFSRDRYLPNEFLRGFNAASIENAQSPEEDSCISFNINNPWPDEMAFWFRGYPSNPPTELIHIASDVCTEINKLDNLVQDECEQESLESIFDPINWKGHIAYISIFHEHVEIEYFGTDVNTQWTESFSKNHQGIWCKRTQKRG
ncbi:MAG: hypothetical protein AB8C95_05230 [Phycisphaeraceae bacterium]